MSHWDTTWQCLYSLFIITISTCYFLTIDLAKCQVALHALKIIDETITEDSNAFSKFNYAVFSARLG
jgi:hypothetical protein